MFIKQDANLIVDIIRSFLPQELSEDPDIIIAGGFALNAFLANQILTNNKGIGLTLLKNNLLKNPIVPFSDIDIWTTKDSISPYGDLFKNRLNESADILTINGGQISSVVKNIEKKSFKDGAFFIQKSSIWANTFEYKNNRTNTKPIQCIVRKQDSVESLLSSFDLGICSIAIYRGEFIIHQSALDSLAASEIKYNNGKFFKRKTLPSRIYQMLRYYKYFEKTGFDFSKEVYDDILATLSDTSTFWSEAKKQGAFSSYGSLNSGISVKITTSNNYEQEVVTKASLSNMIRALPKVFSAIQKMKHWDISHALFVEHSEIFDVKSIINNNVLLKQIGTKKEIDNSSCLTVTF